MQGWFNIFKINVVHHKVEKKNYTVVSNDAEKAFNKVHHVFFFF